MEVRAGRLSRAAVGALAGSLVGIIGYVVLLNVGFLVLAALVESTGEDSWLSDIISQAMVLVLVDGSAFAVFVAVMLIAAVVCVVVGGLSGAIIGWRMVPAGRAGHRRSIAAIAPPVVMPPEPTDHRVSVAVPERPGSSEEPARNGTRYANASVSVWKRPGSGLA